MTLGGKRSPPANKTSQIMLSSASLSTPSVAACGATTVWANGPIAPPPHLSSQNKFKKLAMEDDQNVRIMRCIYAARRDRRNAQ